MMVGQPQSASANIAKLLDRPVWSSLTSCHCGFALGKGGTRRLLVEAGPFVAAQDDNPENVDALERLIVAHGGTATLMQAGKTPKLRRSRVVETAPAVQMIGEGSFRVEFCDEALLLTGAETQEMRALAELAKPGPIEAMTHLLGRFWGLRCGDQLVAMAGERLRQPGFTEISAVSVHPDYRGRRLGPTLVRHVAGHIVARGDIPYLHVLTENTCAKTVYERLGFGVRIDMTVATIISKKGNDPNEANGRRRDPRLSPFS